MSKQIDKNYDSQVFEIIAKRILEKYFSKEYVNIQKMKKNEDKPDLQSLTSNVGVEVTLICNEGDMKASKLFAGLNQIIEEKNKLKKISKIKQHVEYGKGFIISSVRDETSLLENTIKSYLVKTYKLNNEYKTFNRNELFFIDNYMDFNGKTVSIFAEKMREQDQSYNIIFNRIYILNCCNMTLFYIDHKEKMDKINTICVEDLEEIVKKAQIEFCME